MKNQRIQISKDPVETLKRCGGFYQCPKNAAGERFGPLVAYAGTYDNNGKKEHFVGDVYYNFVKAERYPHILSYYAQLMVQSIAAYINLDNIDVVLGAPMGGILLAADLARELGCHRAYAEKKVTVAGTPTNKEESVLVLDRHELAKGDKVVVVEDVCNNFSTTEKLMNLILEQKAQPLLIACALNRSGKDSFANFKVAEAIWAPTEQYRQDHPAVAQDVQKGNVVWKPKNEWVRLEKAMAKEGVS